MSLLPLFQAVESSAVGNAIRDSVWLFPAIEGVHLLALALIGGAVLIVDMRLLGLFLKRHPVEYLAAQVSPYLVGALATMIVTGLLLFSSEAIKCYYNTAFWWKMTFLALATIFTFTVRRMVTSDEMRFGPVWAKLVALSSVALWSGVGIGGRWIGFS